MSLQTDVLELLRDYKRGQQNESRNNTAFHSGADAARRNSHLAPQPGMGIRPEWRSWLDIDSCFDSLFVRQDIATILVTRQWPLR